MKKSYEIGVFILISSSNIVIDDEFKDLLPPLHENNYGELERSIITEGCRDAIVLWGDVIVDGHNRYAICQKHNISFNTVEKDFSSRDEAKVWIISTQVGRRQLSHEEMTYYRGMQYNLEKMLVPNREGRNQHSGEVGVQNGHQPKTAERIAEQYNVAPTTIRRDGRVASTIDKIGAVSPDVKKMILSGKANVTKSELEKLHKASDDEIVTAAGRIADGTYAKKEKPGAPVTLDEALFTAEDGQTDSFIVEPEPEDSADTPELNLQDGWNMPEAMPGKKQSWCAFISAGIDALGSVIGNIEKDLREKLSFVETAEERDILRRNFQSFIDRQTELIKQI